MNTEDVPPERFSTGTEIILWCEDQCELGVLIGFSDYGVVWARTHETLIDENGLSFEPLQCPIRTLTPWGSIDSVEDGGDFDEETSLSAFSAVMDDLGGVDDFLAITSDDAEE